MKNLFFRTNVAPYRVDTYNALHDRFGFELYFYRRKGRDIDLDVDALYRRCSFTPNILKGIELGASSRKLCFGIFRLLRENRPDCVIVPEFQIVTLQILFLRVFLRKKPKVISMCDDSYDMIANGNDFTKIHKIARKLVTRLLDDVIVVEPRVQQWYRQNYGKGIWLPIIRDEEKEAEHYKSLIPLSNELNRTYGLEGRKVILFVGRLVALKNASMLISVADRLKNDCVLVIAGDGPERERLEVQAATCSRRVIFTGQIEGDALHAWYNVADVFCLPSSREAFGAVVNEALLAGCYSVVSCHAGASCLIDGKNGAVIDPFNMDEIAVAIDGRLSSSGPKPSVIEPRGHAMNVFFKERIDNLKEILICRQ